jgi:hypothetical protein
MDHPEGVFGGSPTSVATPRTTGLDGSLGLDLRTNAFSQAAVNPNDPNTIYLIYNDTGRAFGDRRGCSLHAIQQRRPVVDQAD